MSQATKRKHVVKEVLGEHIVPSDQQQIVRVKRQPSLGDRTTSYGFGFPYCKQACLPFLFLPTGDFLIVDPIEEGEKVKAEISFVLCKDHVRSLQKEGFWPEGFSEVAEKHNNNRNRQTQPELPAEPQLSGEESSSEDDSDLFVNTNRRQYHESEEESEEEEAA
uniref:Probable RNA-binding protein EIF1AD n=1 Tax=Nomascus leucogenys TaxID=61853 RepID=A0A2I3GVK6_NOMLE